MGRPRGPLPDGANRKATKANIRRYCQALYEEMFGSGDFDLRTLLGESEQRRLAALALARTRGEPSRFVRHRLDRDKLIKLAHKDIGLAIADTVKATLAARRALARLRNAKKEASEIRHRWMTKLGPSAGDDDPDFSDVLEAGVNVLDGLLDKLPSDEELRTDRPPRERSVLLKILERASPSRTPRELVVLAVLTNAPVTIARGETVREFFDRTANAFAQLKRRTKTVTQKNTV